ncbi:MAG: ATP-binding protein [Deltaproteobacteria bacterium]|nr:ATP-binding protein [Deltaproteobacteria bacterium]
MLERTAEKYLNNWYLKDHRKPLVLRGARQVGKSTLVRHFADKNGLILNEINLERHLYLDRVFKTLDMDVIIRELDAFLGRSIQSPDAVLFLDEIQATPHAIQALRYFYEEMPNLPLISAGSLLEFALADHAFSMPVGRIEYYHLGPMTFTEFLNAVEPSLTRYILEFPMNETFPGTAHQKLAKRQREFLLVGGMPEAVKAFVEGKGLGEVTEVHRSIAGTYQDDFSKYASQKDLVLMQKIFRQIPRIIGQKVKYSNISREDRSRNVKAVIDLFAKARVCHPVFHSHCSGVPLTADINENVYKLIFMDVGLAAYLTGVDWITLQSLDGDGLVNEGKLAEQFVGQHLFNPLEPPQLTYWLRESKTANAETDYVTSSGNQVIPIEVKAGKSGTLKSLHQFALRKKAAICVRFDLNLPEIRPITHLARMNGGSVPVSFTLLSLPLYMVEALPRILNDFRSTPTRPQSPSVST